VAQVPNTRKVFNFVVEINGVDQFEIQKVTVPEVEVAKVMHGDTNHDIKTAGRVSVGDMTFEKVRPAPQSDTWAWDWLMEAQDPTTGSGKLPTDYKRMCIVKEMHPNGRQTLNRWLCEGVWVTKVSQSDLDRNADDNIMETVVLSVDTCKKV
jgi:phage tail-like protein